MARYIVAVTEDHRRRGNPADSINNPIGIAVTEHQARNQTVLESAQVFAEGR